MAIADAALALAGVSAVADHNRQTRLSRRRQTHGHEATTIAVGPNDTVNLRGITSDGDGAQSNNQAVNGIAVSSLYALNIENCIFTNILQFGLSIGPNPASTISVSNAHFSGIGNIGYAVFLNNRTGSNPVQAVLTMWKSTTAAASS